MRHSFVKHQQGFTLLELLVVITLLAVLSVGALVAYENVGENAESAAAANSNVTIDSAIRTYRSITGDYPNQWDSLVLSTSASAIPGLPTGGSAVFGPYQTTAAVSAAMLGSLEAVGIDEVQYLTTSTQDAAIPPNRRHNESVNTAGAAEVALWDDDTDSPIGTPRFAVVPNGVCAAGDTGLFNTTFNNAPAVSGVLQNRFNDSLESNACNFVIALGFGGDAAASTTDSNVAISQAPTYSRTGSVNPATNYARYVGLFLLARDGNNPTQTTDDAIQAGEFLDRARLIAIVTPDGRVIDDALSAAQQTAN